MKEFVSAFNSDVLRPIVSLFIPGAIAAAPALTSLLWANPWLRDFLASARTEASVVVILVVMFLGLLCEDFGSHIEYWFDCQLNKPCKVAGKVRKLDDHGKNWYEYLRIAYRIEPVGHHYLRSLVMRLKFELGSLAAFLLALIGIWFLPTLYTIRVWFSVLPMVLSVVLFLESRWTHQVLSKLREEMLKGVREWPAPPEARTAQVGR